MTSLQFEREIESQLGVLNQTIDRKIMRGLDYSDEARRHKMLRVQMRKARSRRPSMFSQLSNPLGQIMRFASFL